MASSQGLSLACFRQRIFRHGIGMGREKQRVDDIHQIEEDQHQRNDHRQAAKSDAIAGQFVLQQSPALIVGLDRATADVVVLLFVFSDIRVFYEDNMTI